MPVSMSGAVGGMGGIQSPSQRMHIDEARLKARAAQHGLVPGPGSYDPKRMQVTADELAGTTAFKSKSGRKLDGTLKDNGDPGAYNPYDGFQLASQSSRSFNKSQQQGAGGFLSKVKRPELSTPNDAPGPGTYDAKPASSPEAKQGSAFASQTKRGAYLNRAQTPGAGEYDPKDVQLRTNGGDSMFKDKGTRFKKSVELEYSAHVGPGSYSNHEHNSIARQSKQRAAKVSSSFASTSLRGDMFMGHRC